MRDSTRCCARPAAAAPPATASPNRSPATCRRTTPSAAATGSGPGPATHSHDGQLDISPFPEILRAQRRHLVPVHHHWWHVDTAIKDATRAIYHALRGGTWIPGQRRRLRQLAPGTWQQALADVLTGHPGRPDDGPGHPAVGMAIYPDVVWLAARSLRADSSRHHAAS